MTLDGRIQMLDIKATVSSKILKSIILENSGKSLNSFLDLKDLVDSNNIPIVIWTVMGLPESSIFSFNFHTRAGI